MKKRNLFFIVILLANIGSLQAADMYVDTFFNNPTQDLSLSKSEIKKLKKQERTTDKAITAAFATISDKTRSAKIVAADKAADATLFCIPLMCGASRYSLNALFCPGQALTAIKHYDLDPYRCEMKMSDFKKVQCERCCIFGGAACALGCGALACSTCGCAGVAAAAGTGSKMCAVGACITPQIPLEFPYESPTGRSKDS